MSAEERREDVLRAAAAAFADGGYQGTTTQDVAERAGISQPYIFRLFSSASRFCKQKEERTTIRFVRTAAAPCVMAALSIAALALGRTLHAEKAWWTS